ncbi:hypothetical protein [Rhodopirellula sp. P2]|uniref:hypothetical protein n=1 Tax=Rhodopirellula sp. P2 TaxID=2127060 RepID=UPI00236856E1|nr:hypothetical protein [Rhodopirellula sp. P2]WDQ15456.1 hypothetical protein PSR62_17645 [Rhodopirellula sp. P2]
MSRGLCQLITQLASPRRRLPVIMAAAMFAASFNVGPTPWTSSEANRVAAQETTENSEIQQVVGKQLSGRGTSRGGLFSAFGSGSQTSTRSSSNGLLGNLFGGSGSSSSSSSNSGRTATPVNNDRNVDWSGIPTHRSQATSTAPSNSSGPAPLRDPNATSRVAQQPSSQPTSRVPQPPKMETSITRTAPSTPIRVESKSTPVPVVRSTPIAISPVRTEPVEIIPKVSRRILKVETEPTMEELSSTESSRRRQPAVVAKTEPKPVPTKTPSVDVAKAEPKPQPKPVAKPAAPVEKEAPKVASKPAPAPAPAAIAQTAPVAKPAPVAPAKPVQAPAAAKPPETIAQSQPVTTPAPAPQRISQLVPPQSVALAPIQAPAPAVPAPIATPAKTASSSITLGEARQAPAATQPNDSFVAANSRPEPPRQPVAVPSEAPTKMQTFGGGRADTRPSGSLSASGATDIALRPISDRLPVGAADQTAESALGQPQSAWHNSNGVSHDQFQPRDPFQAQSSVPARSISGPAANAGPNHPDYPNTMRGTTPAPAVQSAKAVPASSTSSELPGIRVITAGPKKVMIRQTHPYEIRVENRGNVDAEGLVIRAYIPDWADVVGQQASRGDVAGSTENSVRQLNWRIEHLAAGQSERMLVRLKAARSGTHDLNVDWTIAPQQERMQVEVQEPELALTIDGPDEVIYGQSKTYTIRVLNPGDGVAPNVVFTLSPESSTPQSQRIGDIPSGKEAQFEVELTAQDLGDLKIHGLASGDLELKAEADKNVRVLAADLEAVLTGPELKYQNTDAMYQLELTNHGTTASDDVLATLTLPMGVTYIGGMEGASLIDNQLRWKIASLTPGARRNYQFQCRLDATGQHEFTFKCKGSAAGQTGVALTTNVEAIADLVLSIEDPSAPAPVGQDVTYQIVIRNRGSKPATDVRAIAQFSHGIEPQQLLGNDGKVITGQVLINPIARIDAGEEVRMKIVAKAAEGGHHRFRTEVRSGDTILVAEEATHYMNARNERISRRSGPGGNEFSLPLR